MGEYFGDFGLPGWVGDAELEEITMQQETMLSNQKSIKWKILFGLNIFILIMFWFGVLTDYSWSSNWMAIAFPALASIISIVTLFMMKGVSKLQLLLAISLGILSFLMATLVTFFNLATRYDGDRLPIQAALSPDGTKFVEVYCSTNNAHGGSDHVEVKVKNVTFPFLSREMGVYNYFPSRNCTFGVNPLVRWETNDMIYVLERQAYLHVGFVKWEKSLRDPGEINGDH